MTLKTLITGYPRGATQWAYETLKSAGCCVGLNSVFCDQSNNQITYSRVENCAHEFEVSCFSAPFLSHPSLSGVNVVQLHRHPAAVASSLYWLGIFQPSHNGYAAQLADFINRHCPNSKIKYKGTPLQRTLSTVVEWHGRYLSPHQDAHKSVRVEDGVSSFLDACGVSAAGVLMPPQNVSGCRYYSPEEFGQFLVGDDVLDLAENLGYVQEWFLPYE